MVRIYFLRMISFAFDQSTIDQRTVTIVPKIPTNYFVAKCHKQSSLLSLQNPLYEPRQKCGRSAPHSHHRELNVTIDLLEE